MTQNSITYHLEKARNTEGTLDPATNAVLESFVTEVWNNIIAQPDSYILTKEEFAVFNYFNSRYSHDPRAAKAKARYWDSQPRPAGSS